MRGTKGYFDLPSTAQTYDNIQKKKCDFVCSNDVSNVLGHGTKQKEWYKYLHLKQCLKSVKLLLIDVVL